MKTAILAAVAASCLGYATPAFAHGGPEGAHHWLGRNRAYAAAHAKKAVYACKTRNGLPLKIQRAPCAPGQQG